MRKRKVSIIDVSFFLLSIINIIATVVVQIHYIEYLIIAFLCICLLLKKMNADEFLIYSLFVPNKYLQLLSIPIYLFYTRSLFKNKLRQREKSFIFYITFVGFINCLVYNGFIVGTLFQVIVYYLIFSLINSYGKKIDISIIIKILDKMFVLQVLSCVIQYIFVRKLGDPINGTLISAHYLGVFLMVYFYFVIAYWPRKERTIGFIVRIALIAVLIYASDAKHVAVVFLFSYLIIKLLSLVHIKNQLTFLVSIITIFVVIAVFMLSTNMIKFGGSAEKLINIYIYSGKFNKKYEFFLKSFKEMLGINGLFGFGVGQFGSQISLTLAKGIIYEWRPDYSAFQFAIAPYANAIKGIMTEWYTLYGISESSMVLGYPLVSFIGLFAELGVIGYIWLLRIFDKRFRHGDVSFLAAFFILTLFDTYFEIPCVFVLILIATYANTEDKIISLFKRKNRNSIAQKERIQ